MESVWKVGAIGLVSLLLIYVFVGLAKREPGWVMLALPLLLLFAGCFIYVALVGTWFGARRSLGLDVRTARSPMDRLADRFAAMSIERRVLVALGASLVLVAIALLYRY